jgi:hypothetical protein
MMQQIPDAPKEYYGGWDKLVADAHAEIVAIDPNYRAAQVKTKFGGLRLYLDGELEIQPIIEKYEQLSYTICEICGASGASQVSPNGYWVWTLCQECAADAAS